MCQANVLGGNFCAGFDLTNVGTIQSEGALRSFEDLPPGIGPMVRMSLGLSVTIILIIALVCLFMLHMDI